MIRPNTPLGPEHDELRRRFALAIEKHGWRLEDIVTELDAMTRARIRRRMYGSAFAASMAGKISFSSLGCALVLQLIGADDSEVYGP